jgi:RNA polymerase-binding protein DksA
MPDQQAIKGFNKKLLAKKKELLNRLQVNAEAWSELHEQQIEFEERAANETLAAKFVGLDEQAIQELSLIEKALRKIKDQRYGICELCGRKISEKRLQAMPAAERCLDCASQSVPMFENEEEDADDPAAELIPEK